MISEGILKKVISSLFLGGALSAGPILITTSSSIVWGSSYTPEKRNNKEFGPTCLLHEDVCEILDDKSEYRDDKETVTEEEEKKYQSEYWNHQRDDFCGWGFPESWEINNYLKCREYQIEKNKRE